MREDFLHYIWKHKAFNTSNLSTTSGIAIEIKSLGQHNHNSGPDFFNAQIRIADQLWAGNVEIHIKSSDWYVHNHENDSAYDNVILHVVWEHDSEIFRKDNSLIPTLELSSYVDASLIHNYKDLINAKAWINCESNFAQVDDFLLNNWFERIYIERLERKSQLILNLLEQSKNDWEAVLFKLLLKNFGLKINGESFYNIANSLNYSLVRKLQNNVIRLEALLFGQAGLLEDKVEELYFKNLKNDYTFIQQKYGISNTGIPSVQFFRLRPPNFPTIRLSQFANLYATQHQLFSKIISTNTTEDFYKLFHVGVTDYWKSHYTFSKTSKVSNKYLAKAFIDLLVINTIVPVKFCFDKVNGKENSDELLSLIKEIKIEQNSVVKKFLSLRPIEKHALNSQAMLQLKDTYCDKNKCLQCAIGNSLISKN